MRLELRVARPDGSLGEILPDWTTIEYLDSATDVGTLSFAYRIGGVREELIYPRAELAVIVDGQEIPNSRCVIDETSGNTVTDDPAAVAWAGQTEIGRLVGSIIVPTVDPTAGQDVVTPEEQHYHDLLEKYTAAKADADKNAEKDFDHDKVLNKDDPDYLRTLPDILTEFRPHKISAELRR